MMNNASYSYAKVLYKLSKISWYLEKHAIRDAKKAKHELSVKMFGEMKSDLDKHIEKIRQAIEGLSKEGKF